MESFNSLAAKQIWYIQRGVVPEGMLDRDFCLGQGPPPIHMKVERRAPPEAFLKNQYRNFSVFVLGVLKTWAQLLWSVCVFGTPSRL